MLTAVLVILLVLLLLGAVPVWPYSRGWGFYPLGSLLGLVLLVWLLLYLFGRL